MEKKEYVKPEITKISLDAKTAVLGYCKSAVEVGTQGDPNCADFPTCINFGS